MYFVFVTKIKLKSHPVSSGTPVEGFSICFKVNFSERTFSYPPVQKKINLLYERMGGSDWSKANEIILKTYLY